MRHRLTGLVPVFFIAVLIAFLYGPLANAWFLGDDTQWMWFSAVNPVWKIFFDSDTYLYINDANFTPMLGLSFKTDWFLFRMNPLGYNMHSLLALFASAVVFYLFLRLYAGRIVALSASLLFIVNPATAAVTSNFSIRHYMIGMFWALLSLYMHERASREQKTVFWIISVCSYLVASISKEVYLLLPAFMFLITEGNISQRLRKTFPFWAVLMLYLPWRWYMLGSSMGGYYFLDWTIKGVMTNAFLAVTLPVKYIYGDYWYIFVVFCVLISVLVIIRKGGLKKYLTALCMYGISLAPVVPVMAIFLMSGPSGGRYAFFITTFLIVTVTATRALFEESRMLKISIALLFLFSLFAFYGQAVTIRDAFISDRENSRAETALFLQNREFMEGHYPVWFHDGLRRLYRSFYGKEISTRVYFENSLKFHDPELIKKVKGKAASPYIEKQKKFEEGPLDIDLRLNGRTVTWEIGPENIHFFSLLLRKENEFFYLYPPVKNTGKHTFAKDFADDEAVYFRIFYVLPDGREVVSPEMRLHIPGDEGFHYS